MEGGAGVGRMAKEDDWYNSSYYDDVLCSSVGDVTFVD